MKIDNILLDKLTAQAKESPRLRMNLDLRNSDADSSQSLRRLLDISRTDTDNECRHYAFLRRNDMFRTAEVEKNKIHFNTIESQLEELGVHVIWYEKHNELPSMIRRICAPLMYQP